MGNSANITTEELISSYFSTTNPVEDVLNLGLIRETSLILHALPSSTKIRREVGDILCLRLCFPGTLNALVLCGAHDVFDHTSDRRLISLRLPVLGVHKGFFCGSYGTDFLIKGLDSRVAQSNNPGVSLVFEGISSFSIKISSHCLCFFVHFIKLIIVGY